jgi:hypothetical protein
MIVGPNDDIDDLISIWSMRPPPGSPAGRAWEDGCRQGWRWRDYRAEDVKTRLVALLTPDQLDMANLNGIAPELYALELVERDRLSAAVYDVKTVNSLIPRNV